MSDGTLTQDPRRLDRPLLFPQVCSLAAQQLLCDELESRTRLTCDALTDFQRIVSLCVAERHGRWSFALSSPKGGSGSWCCPRCGHTQDDASYLSVQRSNDNNAEDSAHVRWFAAGECRTPCCSAEELRASSNQCMYASDASALLKRRFAFQQEFGGVLQRIRAASQGIQDSVTR